MILMTKTRGANVLLHHTGEHKAHSFPDSLKFPQGCASLHFPSNLCAVTGLVPPALGVDGRRGREHTSGGALLVCACETEVVSLRAPVTPA